jgi:excisionase family DNA binding protein
MEERYTIQEAAKQLNISPDTLVVWEKAGKINPAKRSARNNYRFYTIEDIAKIRAWMDRVIIPAPIHRLKGEK